MKTLNQAIEVVGKQLGDQACHNDMGGSMQPWYGVGISTAAETIAIIFDEDSTTIGLRLHDASSEAYSAHWDK